MNKYECSQIDFILFFYDIYFNIPITYYPYK